MSPALPALSSCGVAGDCPAAEDLSLDSAGTAEQLIGLSDVVRTVAEGNPEQAAAATAWLQELQAADAEDRFFFMLLGIIAVGRKLA